MDFRRGLTKCPRCLNGFEGKQMTGEYTDMDLEDALDGLQAAERYCSDRGLDDLARRAARLYQAVGEHAPDDDWGAQSEDVVREYRRHRLAEDARDVREEESDSLTPLSEVDDDEFDEWDESAVDPREERDE